MKYRKKPVVVEAVKIYGNPDEIKQFVGNNGEAYIDDCAYRAGAAAPRTVVTIHTLEGNMIASDGDYIIKGVEGEFYPCKGGIFEKTYEPVKEGE